MKKAKSDKKSAKDDQVQVAIWLPRELYDTVKENSAERGMAQVIRSRLEASFRPDAMTRILFEALCFVSEQLEQIYGRAWHKDAHACEVFKAFVDDLLSGRPFKPDGEAEAKPTEMAKMVFRGGPNLKSVNETSRTLATMWRMTSPKSWFATEPKQGE